MRPVSSIELACAVHQPGPCVRALREAVAMLLSKNMTCVRPRCNATPSEDFPHTSHCTLHTSHSTLHLISDHVSSSHLISPHLTSSQLFSSHLISSHMSSKKVFLNCFHLIRALINLSHLSEQAALPCPLPFPEAPRQAAHCRAFFPFSQTAMRASCLALCSQHTCVPASKHCSGNSVSHVTRDC